MTRLQRCINERLGKALFGTGFEDVMAALVDLRETYECAGTSLDRTLAILDRRKVSSVGGPAPIRPGRS